MVDIVPFSNKQLQILTWWVPGSGVDTCIGIICDGSIRAGKTFPMSLSFIEWGMTCFDRQAFGICGKTIGSLRRNILLWLIPQLKSIGYKVSEHMTENYFVCTYGTKQNYFYLFGGKDEKSQDLIQGITLAGILFDEAALMPESFINQATGRCSVTGAKYWFNCNPEAPMHFIKTDWIDNADSKNMLHLHFTMHDNPSLSEERRLVYEHLYHGVFYKRFILGEWVAADGIIFDSFDEDNLYHHDLPINYWEDATHYIVADYGVQNAMVYLYGVDDGDTIWIDDEYYYSGRKERVQKTNAEYLEDYVNFRADRPLRTTIIDPSAATFKVELRRAGYRVTDADNDVIEGIRLTSSMFFRKKIKIHAKRCPNLINKLKAYVWVKPTESKEEEKPLKIDDDPCDALRYLIKTVVKKDRD